MSHPKPKLKPASEIEAERRELVAFLKGKTISGLRFDAQTGGDFDLIFTDGSELEIYAIGDYLAWAPMTAAEVAAEDARDAEILDLAHRAAAEDGFGEPMTPAELVADIERRRGESLDLDDALRELEAREAEQDARDVRELDAQLADLRSGKAPLYEHDEVWAEIDELEARAAGRSAA